MRWAKANVQPITVLERNAYHQDEAGQNARTIINAFKMEAARLQAQAETEVASAIRREGASHTKRWTASIKAGANVDVSNLLADDDLVDLLAIRSEQFNGLITNLEQDVLNRIERETLGAIFEGRSNADIAKSLQEIDGIGRNRARLIARDQASKLNAAMNQYRQEQAGITSYKWSTILDGRERPAHHARNGKIFSWDKPPYDGAPGQAINCRCRALAIIPDDEDGEPTAASEEEIEGDVDLDTITPLLQRVGLTPTKNVGSWTAAEIDALSNDLAKVLEAVSALKEQPGFDVASAEQLAMAIFGYLPKDDVLAKLVGGTVNSLFTRRRTLLFQAVNERLDFIGRLLTQSRAGIGQVPEVVEVTSASETASAAQSAMATQIKTDPVLSRTLEQYTSIGGYRPINDFLRLGTKPRGWRPGEMDQIVNALDRSFSAVVPEDMTLYRGVSLPPEVASNIRVGSEFIDHGFTSTSLDEAIARRMANGSGENFVFVIESRGFKGLDARPLSRIEHEQEVILARNQPMRITRIETIDGLKYVHVEAR